MCDIKKLLRLARRTDLDLWFEDECHFQQQGSRCTMWVPPEDHDPVILHAPTRKSIAVFGAVCAENGKLVTHHSKIFAADTFLEFLQRVVRHKKRDQKMVLVLDNARYHHAKAIQPWLKEHRKIVALDFLPPYSPELNPIERVWKMIRRLRIHNRCFAELNELMQTVSEQFTIWRKPNETLRRLCAIS
jgi:transposase